MINVNKLRIRNLVAFGVNTVKIRGIHTVDIVAQTQEQHVYVDSVGKMDYYCLTCYDIDGIQLTEEWLVKFGFESNDDNGFYPPTYTKKYRHVLVDHEFRVRFIDTNTAMWLEGNTNVHIKYVHELQNLYFAISGEELIIK